MESPSARVQRVNAALHGNESARNSHTSYNSLARFLHSLHDARGFVKSLNSVGDGVARGRGVCRRGETKSRRISTRNRVREELALDHRAASDDFHVEARGRVAQAQPVAG